MQAVSSFLKRCKARLHVSSASRMRGSPGGGQDGTSVRSGCIDRLMDVAELVEGTEGTPRLRCRSDPSAASTHWLKSSLVSLMAPFTVSLMDER